MRLVRRIRCQIRCMSLDELHHQRLLINFSELGSILREIRSELLATLASVDPLLP